MGTKENPLMCDQGCQVRTTVERDRGREEGGRYTVNIFCLDHKLILWAGDMASLYKQGRCSLYLLIAL